LEIELTGQISSYSPGECAWELSRDVRKSASLCADQGLFLELAQTNHSKCSFCLATQFLFILWEEEKGRSTKKRKTWTHSLTNSLSFFQELAT
jgi:hypothetical protein